MRCLPRRSAAVAAATGAFFMAASGGAAIHGPTDGAEGSAVPRLYKNCTNLNKKYPHGLGRAKARDKTSGDPVTTFKRSTRLYNLAMSHNRGLDRDKDGVACEKE